MKISYSSCSERHCARQPRSLRLLLLTFMTCSSRKLLSPSTFTRRLKLKFNTCKLASESNVSILTMRLRERSRVCVSGRSCSATASTRAMLRPCSETLLMRWSGQHQNPSELFVRDAGRLCTQRHSSTSWAQREGPFPGEGGAGARQRGDSGCSTR